MTTVSTVDSTGKRQYAPRMAPEERRDQILDAALDVIAEHGVGAVSVDGIAKAIGVTRPVVYSQFADTDDILRASLKREEARALAQLEDVFAAAGQLSTPDSPADLVQAYLDAVLAEPKRWRAILLPAGYPPAFRKRLVQGQRRIVGVFEKAGRATMPPDTDVELLARALLALLLDAGRIVLDEADTYPPQRVAAFTASMATRIIARPAR